MGCLIELIIGFIKMMVEIALWIVAVIGIAGGIIGGILYFVGGWLIELIFSTDVRGIPFGIGCVVVGIILGYKLFNKMVD